VTVSEQAEAGPTQPGIHPSRRHRVEVVLPLRSTCRRRHPLVAPLFTSIHSRTSAMDAARKSGAAPSNSAAVP
jgi:hypothetical protein